MTSTHRSWPFRSRARGGAVLALVFLLLPVVVMLAVGVAANGFDRAAVIVLLAFGTASVAVGVCIMRTAAFVTCTHEHVVVGFAPFWRTRLRQEDIAEAALVSVDAFAEYGGWGVKGRPHEDRGRLYSAGGHHAVRLRTWDGRTHVVAFSEAKEAQSALSAVERLIRSRTQESAKHGERRVEIDHRGCGPLKNGREQAPWCEQALWCGQALQGRGLGIGRGGLDA